MSKYNNFYVFSQRPTFPSIFQLDRNLAKETATVPRGQMQLDVRLQTTDGGLAPKPRLRAKRIRMLEQRLGRWLAGNVLHKQEQQIRRRSFQIRHRMRLGRSFHHTTNTLRSLSHADDPTFLLMIDPWTNGSYLTNVLSLLGFGHLLDQIPFSIPKQWHTPFQDSLEHLLILPHLASLFGMISIRLVSEAFHFFYSHHSCIWLS